MNDLRSKREKEIDARIENIEHRLDKLYQVQTHFIDALELADSIVSAFKIWEDNDNDRTYTTLVDLVYEYKELREKQRDLT